MPISKRLKPGFPGWGRTVVHYNTGLITYLGLNLNPQVCSVRTLPRQTMQTLQFMKWWKDTAFTVTKVGRQKALFDLIGLIALCIWKCDFKKASMHKTLPSFSLPSFIQRSCVSKATLSSCLNWISSFKANISCQCQNSVWKLPSSFKRAMSGQSRSQLNQWGCEGPSRLGFETRI